MMISVVMSFILSLRMSFILEKSSDLGTKMLSLVFAIVGLYPQFLAFRKESHFSSFKTYNKYLIFNRVILINQDYLNGDFKEIEKRARKVILIEPVIEGLLQLFVQSVILYIIFGPGENNHNGSHNKND